MSICETVLRHSQRGMKLLLPDLDPLMYQTTARQLLEKDRKTILLATGFYVGGFAETDGPPGTFFLAKGLAALGFTPVILTDSLCTGFFPENEVRTRFLDHDLSSDAILDEYNPVAMISIERCGKNTENDYANCRGVSIAEYTPPIDDIFETAYRRGIYTVGIGDGGNEIGMGNIKESIQSKLSLLPCKVPVTSLLIATVSNWGAYGLLAALSQESGKDLLPDYEQVRAYIRYIVSKGSVDGIHKEHVPTVDGFSEDVEKEIVEALHQCLIEQ